MYTMTAVANPAVTEPVTSMVGMTATNVVGMARPITGGVIATTPATSP